MAIETVAAVTAIASTVLSAGATVVSMVSKNQELKYNAALAERNAQISEKNAARTDIVAQTNQQEQDLAAMQAFAEQESVQSASGIALSSPSFTSARRSLKEMARKDALNIRYEGQMRTNAFLEQANEHRTNAGNISDQSAGILAGGAFELGSSLIGGYDRYTRYKKAFGGGGDSNNNWFFAT